MKKILFVILFLIFGLSLNAQIVGKKYKTYKLKLGEEFKIGKYRGVIKERSSIDDMGGYVLAKEDLAVKLKVLLYYKDDTLVFFPIYILVAKTGEVGVIQDYNKKYLVGAVLRKIDSQKEEFSMEIYTENGKLPKRMK